MSAYTKRSITNAQLMSIFAGDRLGKILVAWDAVHDTQYDSSNNALEPK